MRKVRIWILLVVIVLFSVLVFQRISSMPKEIRVQLRNGQVYKGRLIRLQYAYVTLLVARNKTVTYFAPEIDNVDGLKLDDFIESRRSHNAAPSAASDFRQEEEFKTRVRNALIAGRYGELEGIYKEALVMKARMLSGKVMLNLFYTALRRSAGKGEGAHRELLKKIEAWRQSFPSSHAVSTCKLNAYIDLAWDYRGNGYSRTVSEAGWKGFSETIGRAWKICQAAATKDIPDPDFWSTCIDVGNAAQAEEDELLALLERGIKVDPTYYPLYLSMAVSYLPRWGGQPADLENFADKIYERTRTGSGYANYVWMLDWVRAIQTGELPRHHFSWDRIKAGFEEMTARYPKSFYLLNSYCWYAVYYKDKPLAASLFERIGKRWDGFSDDTWGTAAEFEAKRTWAQGGGAAVVANDLNVAIEQGNVDKVREYIAGGGNVLIQDANGSIPLFTALGGDQYSIANVLLDAMTDVGMRNRWGQQAIHFAAMSDTPVWLMKKLIAKGADVNSKTNYGSTPLMSAAQGAMYRSLNYLLLRKDVEVNAVDSKLATALHLAAQHGKDKSIDMLLAHPGIQINLRDGSGNTALHYAVSHGTVDAVAALLKGKPDVNVRNAMGLSPLDMARQNKRQDVIDLLIAQGADQTAAPMTDEKSYEATRVNESIITLLKASRFDEARPLLHKVIEMNPDIAAPYFNLYLITMREGGDLGEADKLLTKALAIEPHVRLFQQQMGRLRFRQNRKEEAMQIFKKYVSDYPDDPETKELLGEFPELAK